MVTPDTPHPNKESHDGGREVLQEPCLPQGWVYFYDQDKREIVDRLIQLEHTVYTGNGRPSLVQQVAELTLRLMEVVRAMEENTRIAQQKQSTRYLVLWETLSFAVITVLSTIIATYLAMIKVEFRLEQRRTGYLPSPPRVAHLNGSLWSASPPAASAQTPSSQSGPPNQNSSLNLTPDGNSVPWDE